MGDAAATIADAVRSALDERVLRDVIVQLGIDSEGADAFDVTVVLAEVDLSGAQAAQVLLAVQTALEKEGDERFPIVTFTTEDELALDGDPES